jgi:benzodiazapine receptor
MEQIVLIYTILLFLLLSISGGIGSVTSTLTLPSFYPPTYLFGIVWPILFVLFGIYLYYAPESLHIIGLIYYALLLLWSPLFANTGSTAVGFFYLFFILLLTIALLILSITNSHPYSWILLPQLVWISFATLISYYLYKDN